MKTVNYEVLSSPEESDFPQEWYEVSAKDHFWFEWRFKALQKLLRDLPIPLEKELEVLEIGCGTGLFRSQIEEITHWRVDGTDLNRVALESNPGGRGRTMPYNIFSELPEFLGRYDVLIIFDVLEHIEDPIPFLQSAVRHLKPGGWILINVPALMLLYSQYDTVAGHYRRYSRSTLTSELLKAGNISREVSLRYWGFSLVPVLLARKFIVGLIRDKSKVIRVGFKPPSSFVNRLFKFLMWAETSLADQPLCGTSILAAVNVLDP